MIIDEKETEKLRKMLTAADGNKFVQFIFPQWHDVVETLEKLWKVARVAKKYQNGEGYCFNVNSCTCPKDALTNALVELEGK